MTLPTASTPIPSSPPGGDRAATSLVSRAAVLPFQCAVYFELLHLAVDVLREYQRAHLDHGSGPLAP